MKRSLLFLGITFSCVVLNAQSPYYYYYEGEKQYLELNTEYAFLSLKEQKIPVGIEQNKMKETILQSDKSDKKQYRMRRGTNRFWTELDFEEKLSDENYLQKLSDIKRQNKDVIVSPYFKSNDSDKIGLSNFFYVKLRTDKDTALLRQMAEKTKTLIVEQDPFMPLWFVLSMTETSELNSLECSNVFYESGLFLAAEPALMLDLAQCANDTYFNEQWGLNNTGQNGGTNGVDIKICDAWQISTGSNVTVAVLDEGIELNHPDLARNIHPLSYDCDSRISPSILHRSHGTSCAGIVGAVRNNIGTSGVAPDCKLMSISSNIGGYTPNLQQHLAAGINWAWQNGADVISNSWVGKESQFITDAINAATTQGRNGKGCVVVFGSGNDNGNVSYPATLPNVLTVGAISPCGQRKSPTSCDENASWGSCYGTQLDVVAPGALIPTTTNTGGYTQTFGGTSSACPHVAGVAALILSVKPDLTQLQVRQIIESTCTKLSGYSYSNNSDHPNGTWNEQVGHGLVDAYAAVGSVATHISGPSTVCYNDSIAFTLNNSPAGTITWSISGPFAVSGNGVTAKVVRTGTDNTNGTLTAHVNGSAIATKTITPCISTISGSSIVCPGGTATFTASNVPAGYTWGYSRNLTPIIGSPGSFKASSSPGSAWVSVRQGPVEIAKRTFSIYTTLSITGPSTISQDSKVLLDVSGLSNGFYDLIIYDEVNKKFDKRQIVVKH